MRDYKQDVYDIQGTTNISSIPLEEFEDLEDLRQFAEVMKTNNIGIVVSAEHSNFHQGVLIEVFDKKTCSKDGKDMLLK